MNVAFVLPYGEPSDGFFADTLLALLCADARARGHRAEMVRVYYDGRSAERDAEIVERLVAWLAQRACDLVVVERLFDATPMERHRRAFAESRVLQVTRGDSVEPGAGVDYVLGSAPGVTRRGTTRRTPQIDELRAAFDELLSVAPDLDAKWRSVPGLFRGGPTSSETGTPLGQGEREGEGPLGKERRTFPFAPVIEQEVIAPGAAPPVVRKTVFGNVGCPYARDPAESEHFRGVELPVEQELSRLGCAFCHMGGDYEVRSDEDVVQSLVAQARYYAERVEGLEEIVLSDQHPIRYLAALMRGARGLPQLRWLFPARADAVLREQRALEEAILSARANGQILEVYLSGFEAFSDRELARYNKGTTKSEMLESVELLRELGTRYPDAFEYARSRGHSMLLFNPWTRPEDVRESVDAMRAYGLGELFFEVGRNRLRLYPDLPITYAAERDGALEREWQAGDEGAARRKGYSSERPWRFLDGRTRALYGVAQLLRDELGTETELAQLSAAVAWAEAGHADVGGVARDLARLRQVFEMLLLDGARPKDLRRATTVAVEAVLFGGACNNGCGACPHRDGYVDDATLLGRVDAAAEHGRPLLFAGREPTLHPEVVQAVARSARPVGVVSNGRRFAYAAFTQAAVRAGLTAGSVKLFGATPNGADAITRDAGGFAQACDGVRQLRGRGVALELRTPLYRASLSTLERMAELAVELDVPALRVEAAVDAIGLDALSVAADGVERLARRCSSLGVALEAAPLRAGMRDFRYMPAHRERITKMSE